MDEPLSVSTSTMVSRLYILFSQVTKSYSHVMSNGQAEKTILWIAAATLVLGLSAWAERKLRRTPPVDARDARPVQLTKDTKVGDKVVHGVIGLIGEFNCRPPAERFASSSGGITNDMRSVRQVILLWSG